MKRGTSLYSGRSSPWRVAIIIGAVLGVMPGSAMAFGTGFVKVKNPIGTSATSVHYVPPSTVPLGSVLSSSKVLTHPGGADKMTKTTNPVNVVYDGRTMPSLGITKNAGETDIAGRGTVRVKIMTSGTGNVGVGNIYFDYGNGASFLPADRAMPTPQTGFAQIAPEVYSFGATNDGDETLLLTDMGVWTNQDPSVLESGLPSGAPTELIPALVLAPGESASITVTGFDPQLALFGELSAISFANPAFTGYVGAATIAPEPGSLVLLGLGALGALRRRSV